MNQFPKSIKIKKKIGDNLSTSDLNDIPFNLLKEKPVDVQQVLIDTLLDGDSYFPRGIHIEDIDRAVVDYFNAVDLVVDEKKVPLFLLTMQRFSEFLQTWKINDDTNAVVLPIFTLVRDSLVKQGTMLGGVVSNVPETPTFTLHEIEIIRNGRKIKEFVQIPQPIYVDIQYKLSLFANHQRDVNKFNEMILKMYKGLTRYISVNGHNIQITIDDITDQSKTDLESRRYYHHIYLFTVKGYLLDEKDYIIRKSLREIKVRPELSSFKRARTCFVDFVQHENNCDFFYEFKFTKKSPSTIEKKMEYNMMFTYDNTTADFEVEYQVNNVSKIFPFAVQPNDILKITIPEQKHFILKLSGNKT